ncbi:MAG: CPBP family intramembrane glutamic endopeptidase [Candidatus Acidiferrales bacterium]
MQLKIYGNAPAEPAARWRPRWLIWWQEQVEEFHRWAAREARPEEDVDRSFMMVAGLLGLALAAQFAQLALPAAAGYLLEHDVLERATWAGFTLAKQGALFVLVLLALAIRDERLRDIGFPQMDARRWPIAVLLVGIFAIAALVRHPQQVLEATGSHWMVPVWPAERLLFVGLGLGVAVMEETIFRGFAVVWTYRWSEHLPLAILFPALIFAAGHAFLGLINVFFAFFAAIVFSLVLIWQRDLFWPMVIHFLIDTWVLLV